jgi:hypothetical protein
MSAVVPLRAVWCPHHGVGHSRLRGIAVTVLDEGRSIPNEEPEPTPLEAYERDVPPRKKRDAAWGFDANAERRLIAAVLAHPDENYDAAKALSDVDFFDHKHQALWRAIQTVAADGTLPWAELVTERLRHEQEWATTARDVVTGLSIEGFTDNLLRSDTVAFATAVASYARSRRLASIAERLKDAAQRNDAEAMSTAFAEAEVVNAAVSSLLVDDSLQPVDLEPVLNGSAMQPVPDLLTRDDGQSLLYPGAVNGVHGQSGDGKGWVVCHLVTENARKGRRTLYLDLEDTAHSITARLLLLGMDAADILNWLVYVRPQVPLENDAVAELLRTVEKRNVACVVIDSLGEAFALEGLNEDKDVEVGPWYRRVVRPLADTGAAVVIVDHSTKAADNPLHPSGSKRKRAAITGASYLAEAIEPFVKGKGGRLRLTCAKDRHGTYRRGEAVGDVVMTTGLLSDLRLSLYAPSVTAAEDAPVPTILAARAAVKAAKEANQPLSQKALAGLMKIRLGSDGKRGGIDFAVSSGALVETSGPHRSRLFTYVHDLEEKEDE